MDKRNKTGVIIFGYGKMGKIYEKHLQELGVGYHVFDLNLEQHNDLTNALDYLQTSSHAIIATPTNTHAFCYEQIRFHNARIPILIEKPVVDTKADLYILKDKNVYCGMNERCNKALIWAKENWNLDDINSVDIRRNTANVNFTLEEMLIHDLDIKEFFFKNAEMRTYYRYYPEKLDSTLEFYSEEGYHLINLSSQKVYLEDVELFSNPEPFTIKDQLISFLGSGKCDATKAHQALFEKKYEIKKKESSCCIY